MGLANCQARKLKPRSGNPKGLGGSPFYFVLARLGCGWRVQSPSPQSGRDGYELKLVAAGGAKVAGGGLLGKQKVENGKQKAEAERQRSEGGSQKSGKF